MAVNSYGKVIKTTLDEMTIPEETALIVVDMQNDFCSKGGHYDIYGKDMSMIKEMIPRLSKLIDKCRNKGIDVVYIQNMQLPGARSMSPEMMSSWMKRWGDDSKILYTIRNTWGCDIIDWLKPEEGDIIINKHRAGGFTGTDLDIILRSNGKKNIMITGVITEGCVESTARDAWLRDYYVIIIEDCIASCSHDFHQAQLMLMRCNYHFIVTSDEIFV